MFVSEEADGLKAKVEYCTDLFDADTIRRMLGHYQVLLEGIVANPEARIAELPILTRGRAPSVAGGMEPDRGGLPAGQVRPPTF